MLRPIVTVICFLFLCSALHAQVAGEAIERVTNDEDVSELVRRYVESRVDKPLFWKPCLKLGGDVRFEYNHYDDWGSAFEDFKAEVLTQDGGLKEVTFKAALRAKQPNVFSVNGNIYLEFDTRKTWAKLQIEAVNPGGTWPETPDSIRMKRALIGYTIYGSGCDRWYAELGRQRLDEHFDSQVQFGSRTDGLFTRVSKKMPRLGEAYVQLVGSVVNAEINQYAYAVEVGALDLFKDCYYAKLSFIDWTNGGISIRNRNLESLNFAVPATAAIKPAKQPDLAYQVAQLLVGKKFPALWQGKNLKLYGAVLYNLNNSKRVLQRIQFPDADAKDQTVYVLPAFTVRGQRLAWYVGAQFGEVCKCGDWALKLVYEYVEAFSIFPPDNNGIGRGTGPNNFYIGSGLLVPITNYKGMDAEAAYALSDNITIRAQFQHADHIKNLIGASHFNRFMMRFVYAF